MQPVPASLPDKERLEREQLYLTNKKLEQDAKPEKWWSKVGKGILAFGGIVTVAASAYGIWDSYDKTIRDREQTRIADQRAQIGAAIKRLETAQTISNLVGVSVLSGYLEPIRPEQRGIFTKFVYRILGRNSGSTDANVHRQVLLTLASLIATTDNSQTSAVVLDFIDSLPDDRSISSSDWLSFQKMLVNQNYILKDLRDKHDWKVTPGSKDDKLITYNHILHNLGFLIAINIRHGRARTFSDYNKISCQDCDFESGASSAVFPNQVTFLHADLTGAHFERAVLTRPDFTGAVLKNAHFDGATLTSALFEAAELTGAKFISADAHRTVLTKPNFTSAALKDAHFEGATLISSNFEHAQISGAKFTGAHFIGGHIEPSSEFMGKNAPASPGAVSPVEIVAPDFGCAILEDVQFDGYLFPGILEQADVSEAPGDYASKKCPKQNAIDVGEK